jgi:hypothetical protein
MVDYRQVQTRLNELGQNPPLTEDGLYGPKTKAAIIAFQSSRGLAADGIVGPKTLAALSLSSSAPAASSSSSGASVMGNVVPPSATVQKYWEIAKNAAAQAGMSQAELEYCFSVAKGEGGFGQGWGNPSASTIEKSQRFGLTGYEGAGSNNWGATQGSGDAGSFPHVDSHADGSLYTANYKKWSTPEKGFLDMANIILRGGKRGAVGAADIKAAIKAGNLRKAVFAQHANGYFELNPEQYLRAVLSNYASLRGLSGWKNLLAENGVKAGLGVVGLALLGGLGYAGYKYLTKS